MQVSETKQTASNRTARLPRGGNSERVKKRLQRTLELFDSLPDVALVDVKVVSALRGRSTASTWRDVASGRLARPVRVGASSRWRAGDIRVALKGAPNE